MKYIKNQEFGGERPLYCEKGLRLENVTIHAGESSLKEGSDIEAVGCRFEGKYPLWCCNGFKVRNCEFTEGGRAALWYSRDLVMEDTLVHAPKIFRQMKGGVLRRVTLDNAQETFWSCSDFKLEDVTARNADYIFMHCSGIEIDNFHLDGNYSFQWTKNVVIRNSILNTKDAFWETDNVTVVDSEINGEFLGWHSRGLQLVRCKISGSQPLCYADGLVLEDCSFDPGSDLAFEYSEVNATVKGHIHSIKNPRTGVIKAGSVGAIIIDGNIKSPGDCRIETQE